MALLDKKHQLKIRDKNKEKWDTKRQNKNIKEQKTTDNKSTKNRHGTMLKPMALRPQRGRYGVKAE